MLKLVKFLWSKKLDITKAFITAVVFSVGFLILCSTLAINTANLTYEAKAATGAINIWRIVIVFGVLTLGLSIFSIIKKKMVGTVSFLWFFWAMGTIIAILISRNAGMPRISDLLKVTSPEMKDIVSFLILIAFSSWAFSVFYCRRIANRLRLNTYTATLLGVFLPIISALIYAHVSKDREGKKRLPKVISGVAVAILLISAGVIYYTVGTPEYSLYRLKEALISSNDVEVDKYLDIGSVAENFDETPAQSKEWIDSLNVSVLEIKEENPDKSKDASAYISTGLSGKYVKDVHVDYSGGDSSNPNIALQFDGEGSKLFSEITKRNIGKRLAIYISDQLISSPVVQSQIENGAAVISGQNASMARFTVETINEEKISTIGGFKIRSKTVDGDSAKVTIGKAENKDGFELTMKRTGGRYWRVDKIDVTVGIGGEKLPTPEGEKPVAFSWKYKGKNYSLDQKLYDSYYKFYNALPAQSFFNGESLIQELEKRNELFVGAADGDNTISELAQSIRSIGEENKLNENQIVELVASFVQTIPYDYDEFNNRESVVPKIDYPYETLYKNKGICSDKSYLAYSLLRELGYGASFFQFPEDQHIAVGVQCPLEYSNYDSGYCFLETTSLGNKIGSTPSIIKDSGIAASEIVLSDFGADATEDQSNPLGKIEVVNKTSGLVYTGIIDTIKTQKEIDNLLYTVRKMDSELNASRRDLDNRDGEIGKMVDKLDKLAKSDDSNAYDDYNRLYSKYKKAYSDFEKDRKAFNAKIATRNQLNNKYNSLVKSFYQ